MRHAFDGAARQGRVGGDDAVDPVARERLGDAFHLFAIHVRRDFQGQRHVAFVLVGQARLRFLQLRQQGVEFGRALQLAQVLGVRRRDVHRHIAGVGVDFFQAQQVVVGCPFDGRVGVLADVQAQHAGAVLVKLRRLHVGHEGVHAAIIKAHAVDDALRLRQAEHARFRIARLRARRDGAHFDGAKTQVGQRIDVGAILVQARGQADRVREGDAHYRARIGCRFAGQLRQAQRASAFQGGQGEMVGRFGIHRKQQRAGEGVQEFFRHGGALNRCAGRRERLAARGISAVFYRVPRGCRVYSSCWPDAILIRY